MGLEQRRRERLARNRLTEKLRQLGAMSGLTESQQKRLTQEVSFVSLYYSRRQEIGQAEKQIDKLFDSGPSQVRRLQANLMALRRAFDKFKNRVVRVEQSDDALLGRVLENTFQLRSTLGQIQAALDKLDLSDDAVERAMQKLWRPRIAVDDPTNLATRDLFEFFVQCGLGKNDASQRIAKIGNALWGWNIQDQDRSESYTPDRSAAILKRVKRNQAQKRR